MAEMFVITHRTCNMINMMMNRLGQCGGFGTIVAVLVMCGAEMMVIVGLWVVRNMVNSGQWVLNESRKLTATINHVRKLPPGRSFQSGLNSNGSLLFTLQTLRHSYQIYLRKGLEVCGMLEEVVVLSKFNVYGELYDFVRYSNV